MYMQPIEIKPSRFSYLIPIPFVLLLMWVFYWFTIAEPGEHFTGAVKVFLVVTVFVEAVGLFLTIYFFRNFLKPPVVFRMNNDGIMYNSAGVSTGMIRWDEIEHVTETVISVYRNGTAYQNVLAITLRDPEAFRKRYKAYFQKAMKLAEDRYNASVLLEPGVLGKNYETVKAEIGRRIPFTALK